MTKRLDSKRKRYTLSLLMTMLVVLVLLYPTTTATAISVSIEGLQGATIPQGSTQDFDIDLTIESGERVPISTVRVTIDLPNGTLLTYDFPLTGGSEEILALSTPQSFNDTVGYGYGYWYDQGSFYGYGYGYFPSTGYGHGYYPDGTGYGFYGLQTLRWDANLRANAANLPEGEYKIRVQIQSNDVWWGGPPTETTFTITAAAPVITIISPESKTYKVTSVPTSLPLTYTVDRPTDWVGYSLDGAANITLVGDTTLSDLSVGSHTLTVYANDTAGNMGRSTVSFTVSLYVPPPPPPPYVQVGDEVWVNGTAGVGELVEVYWDFPSPEMKLGEGYAVGGKFNILVTIPEDVAGDHWIIVDGESSRVVLGPKITLTPDTGLAGDTVSVKGTGFGDAIEVTLKLMNDTSPSGLWDMALSTSPSTVETNSSGTFQCTFDIPSNATDYGTYTVNGTDAYGNSDETVLTVGPTIALDTYEGPSGTVIGITGNGFTQTEGLAVTVTIGWVTAPEVADIEIASDGTFSGEIIVFTLDVGIYAVIATDGNGVSSGAVDFEVTGRTAITLTPISGPPGGTVTIEGVNFTAIADVSVTLDFGPLSSIASFKTNSTGGFRGTFTVPLVTPDPTTPYTVNASDENDLYAEASFWVAVTTLAISPAKGPTGIDVLLLGGGFTPNAYFNVTIDGELMIGGIGILTSQGAIPAGFRVIVPTIPVGDQTITVTDEDGLTGTVSFEVTETTEFVLTPSSAPVNGNVTIEANYFTAQPGRDLTIVIYNYTWDQNLEHIALIMPASGWIDIETNASGSFRGWFFVPDLSLGDYWINVTDPNGLYACEVPFSITEVTVEVGTLKAMYTQGEDVTFKINCTLASDGSIEIMDPECFNRTLMISAGSYQKVGDWCYVYPSLSLSSDAPIGTCYWTADIGGTVRKGSFLVVPELSVKLVGEFDYLWREPVRIRLAALVMDANTLEPVSGADVTAQIYDIEGNNVSLVMLERIPGSGIYEWNSSSTIRELKVEKGVYLVRAQVSYMGVPMAYDISLFHIDPPAEGTHEVLTYMAFTAVMSAAVTALVLRRRKILNRLG